MKPPLRLAALLLLPASLAPAGEPLPFGPAYSVQQAEHPMAAVNVPAAAAPSWQWPLAPRPQVLRDFDPPPKPWLSGHRGVDLGAMADGAQVTSPAAGTVSFVGMVVDRPVITLDHGDGLRSSFEPVASTLAAGSPVAAGVRRGEEYVDPLQFVMDLRPSVLLPLDR